jgi:hypothetical protein
MRWPESRPPKGSGPAPYLLVSLAVSYDEWNNPNNKEDYQYMLTWSPYYDNVGPRLILRGNMQSGHGGPARCYQQAEERAEYLAVGLWSWASGSHSLSATRHLTQTPAGRLQDNRVVVLIPVTIVQ